jgi:alkyl sulfatase BDS1-like metallo-beta-lactamase superfamily hydrolase
MTKWKVLLRIFICIASILSCSNEEPSVNKKVVSHEDLAAHTHEFRKEIITVTDGVHVAIGFGLANSVLLEGDGGVVIVDTMESAEAAQEVKQAFGRITSKPVKAIIYTHYHPDHTFGTRIMAGDDNPEIYSHVDTLRHLDRIVNVTRDITYRRGMRQFGTFLSKEAFVNAGIGPALVFDNTKTPAMKRPTRIFTSEKLELEIAGINMVLVHAPGETPDQIYIWLPEKRVLLPADNFYKSFPNLYAIRGTAYRDVMLWVASLDNMRTLGAEYLVPHHTRPIVGTREIYQTLTNYRDAIQFVHDQTVLHMNKGLTADEIVEKVKLPSHLAPLPYLHEYYGTVAWSVRAIFGGYLGWFSGNATDLFPLSPRERARRITDMAGGEEALLEKARDAVLNNDFQWALELTDQLILINPELEEARRLKETSLVRLAEMQTAATARNYYLTQSLEVTKQLTIGKSETRFPDIVQSIPLEAIFRAMAVKLDAEKSADVDTIAGFRFPDTGETFTLHVRRGILEVRQGFPEHPDLTVSVDSYIWKEMVVGIRNPTLSLVKDVKKEGGTINLIKFLRLFKENEH